MPGPASEQDGLEMLTWTLAAGAGLVAVPAIAMAMTPVTLKNSCGFIISLAAGRHRRAIPRIATG